MTNSFVRIVTFVQYVTDSAINIKSTDFIGSFAKGISVIEAFSVGGPRLSVSETSKLTGLDRASARRCLLTLTELGYAEYDGKFFSLSLKCLNLFSKFIGNMSLTAVVQPLIDDLSELTGQTISISVLDDTDIVCASSAAQRSVLSIGLLPGSRLPAFCTAMGRILLGGLATEEVLERLNRSELLPLTPITMTDPKNILEAIEVGISRGYVIVDEELELGLRSLSVPVYNRNGKVDGALNIGVATAQISVDELENIYLKPLLDCAEALRLLIRAQKLPIG